MNNLLVAKIWILSLVFLIFDTNLYSQNVGINATGASPDSSAILDVSSITGGILIPRMTSVQRIAISNPATGLLVFDNVTNTFWFYNGISWTELVDVVSSNIADADNDTKIDVEENPDEDIIRFYISGDEAFKLRKNAANNTMLELPNGDSNVLIGHKAGDGNITGKFNTFIGEKAGTLNDSASLNTFIGNTAGRFNTKGEKNVFLGDASGLYNDRGNGNTFSGAKSGRNNVNGSNNLYLGYESGFLNVDGNSNVFLGYNAGHTQTSGNNNILIGSSVTADNTNLGNQLNIGNLIKGNLQTGNVTFNNAYTFPNVDGTINQVLKTDGAGNINWEASNNNLIIDADGDTKIDVEENSDEDIIRFRLANLESFRLKKNLNGNTMVEIPDPNSNIFIGNDVGELNTNGRNSVIIGDFAGKNNTTGIRNTFLGYSSGETNTTGNYNTFLGYKAGSKNTTAGSNVYLGYLAGELNTGISNTFIGSGTGKNQTGGNNNILIGHNINADSLTLGNQLNIGNIIKGNLNSGKVTFNNAYSFPNSDGTINQVLKTNGAGNITWETNNNNLLADIDGDTNIDVELNSDDDIIRFNIQGNERMSLSQNANNFSMLEFPNGNTNLFIGNNSGKDNSTGLENTFIGDNSGSKNNIGSTNTFLGRYAGRDNTSGSHNVIVGRYAGRSNVSGNKNTFIGTNTGNTNTTGNSNLFIGYSSGENIDSGLGNLFIGTQAGKNQTGGNFNILIGTDVEADSLNLSYQLNIGNVIKADLSSKEVTLNESFKVMPNGSISLLANNAINRVGITQNSLSGSGGAAMELTTQDSNGSQATRILLRGANNSADVEFYRGPKGNEVPTMHIEGTNGNVGIGTSNPTQGKLVVQGFATSLNAFGYLNVNGVTGTAHLTKNYSIWAGSNIAAQAFNAVSDERVKNIKGISNAKEDLKTLMQIDITDYKMKDSIQQGNVEYKKVIAQQVKEVYPQAVTSTNTDFIPNIYKTSKIKEGWIELETEVEVGDKIKLLTTESEEIVSVLEVSKTAFKVSSELEGNVFVYGKQVSDFHTVDYEAISMLNISATQQMYRQLVDLEYSLNSNIEDLKAQIKEIQEIMSLKASK